MIKTLNEQLCEIVELPYYKTEVRACEILPIKKRKIYLDFEQPENFVKLFNLELAKNQGVRQTLATLITKKFELTVDSRHFISQVMRLIQYALYYQVDAELIKQSIRDYDGWVWR